MRKRLKTAQRRQKEARRRTPSARRPKEQKGDQAFKGFNRCELIQIIHTKITTATTITRAATKIIVVIEEMAEAEAEVVVEADIKADTLIQTFTTKIIRTTIIITTRIRIHRDCT